MIKLTSVSKDYILSSNPLELLKGYFFSSAHSPRFSALKNVSLTINKGEVLGIIGKNGAGKSTILQIICGNLKPSSGTIHTEGRIGSMLELGAGFHPEFTGIENIYLNAATMGLKKSQILKVIDEIIEFAGIGNFIEKPVKTYSNGMNMRLAFSIATCTVPEILVIDEVLSVGDQEFSLKCIDRILELKKRGTTIVFCSHSKYQVEALCDRVAWVEKGEVKKIGPPKEVTFAYHNDDPKQVAQLRASQDFLPKKNNNKNDVFFEKIKVFKNDTQVTNHACFRSRKDSLKIDAYFSAIHCSPSLALSIRKSTGEIVASAGSANDGVTYSSQADGKPYFSITFPALPLLTGSYYVDMSLLCENALQNLDVVSRVFSFSVEQHDLEQGVVHLQHTWQETL